MPIQLIFSLARERIFYNTFFLSLEQKSRIPICTLLTTFAEFCMWYRRLKAHLHGAKVEAKAKSCSDVHPLFFEYFFTFVQCVWA